MPRQTSMDLDNVVLKFAVGYFYSPAASTAFQRQHTRLPIRHRLLRKFQLPEIGAFVEKSHAVSVQISVGGNFAHHAHFGFAVGLFHAQDQLLFGRESVGGENACTVETQHNGVGMLGESVTFFVVSEEKDGDPAGDAAAASCRLILRGGVAGVHSQPFLLLRDQASLRLLFGSRGRAKPCCFYRKSEDGRAGGRFPDVLLCAYYTLL